MLKDIISRLQADSENITHPIRIGGIGGIGKTELAMAFARKQIEIDRTTYLVTLSANIPTMISFSLCKKTST